MSSELSNIIRDNHGNVILMEEIQWVCRQHHLGEITRIIGVLEGGTNLPILVETEKGKYVLRYLTHSAPKGRINFIEDILLCLKDASIPVVNAIKNESGDYYSFIHNRMIQVYPFIEGSRFKFEPEHIKSNARMLNMFHTALNSYKQGPLPDESNCPTEENLKKRLNRLYQNKESISKSSLSKIESLYSTIIELWKKADKNNLLETIIHDDWHPWNLIYSEDGSVSCILDFDLVRPGKRIYDVAYCIYWIYMLSPNKMSQTYSKMFIEGYEGLTPEEKNILTLVLAKIALFFIIEFVSDIEKQLKVNEPLIEFFLSQEGKEFLL
ncbi:phosphotransferase [Bacillus sp. ISL-75]|uniref:phosphotransferase n=1 Tax=Bacillus sp. ISL-75 TaxID=2819137 RepID=UPI001BEA16EC|nr:phosphotransferase [Bacillus sp. ISL-75]MBT2725605.1 phosphotransferase [Bacillus sp. ISL-75]